MRESEGMSDRKAKMIMIAHGEHNSVTIRIVATDNNGCVCSRFVRSWGFGPFSWRYGQAKKWCVRRAAVMGYQVGGES